MHDGGASQLPFLGEIVALVVVSAGVAYVCHRLRLLPIVGFLLAGVLIGPHALGWVSDAALIESVAEIGVLLLLFTLGIEFSLERIWRIRRVVFIAGTLQVALTIVAVTAILALAGVGLRTGIFTGCLVALSSTAIVFKVLGEGGETTSDKGEVAIAILIFQDLAVVALVLFVPVLAGDAISPRAIGGAVLTAAIIVVLVVAAARRVMPFILERVARTCAPEIFLLTVVAICFGTAWITSLAGVSVSLGAFLAGLVVSESRFSHHAFGEILPLQMLFTAAFFVSVGMLLDVSFVVRHPLLLVSVVAAVILLKWAAATGSALLAGRRLPAALAAGLLLAQIGEFSFVLQRVGRPAGLVPAGIEGMGEQLFIASSVVLMALTPLLGRAARALEGRAGADAEAAATEPPAGAPISLENHVIVAGYGMVARYLARVLKSSGVPFVILTLSPTGATEAEQEGMTVVRGNYSRTHLLELANIERAKMLVIPDDEPEMTRRVTAIARVLNPTIGIVARTRFLGEIDVILSEGADEVLADEQEVAVQLFTRVLGEYRIAPAEVDEHVRTVRAGGYAALRVPEGEMPEIRCSELTEECFDTRTVVLRPGSGVSKLTVGELTAGTGLVVVVLEHDGRREEPGFDAKLAEGDRLTVRGSAGAFASAAPLFRTGAPEEVERMDRQIRTIALSSGQRGSPACEHVRAVRPEVSSSAAGCEDCIPLGETWVHLRICMTCGGVRCCDSSKNRHATRHWHASEHPIIRSFQPGESWAWCYPDEVTL